MKKIAFVIICLSLVGCSVSPSVPQDTPSYPDLLIELQRGGGFGPYPVYNLIIYSDGRVDYEGIAFVKIEGKQSSKIDPNQIEELVVAIKSIDFFSLEDHYSPSTTDMPFIQLSVTLDGQSKNIWHYGSLSCGVEIVKELCKVERKIDEVVNSSQWVKQGNE